MTLKKNNLDKRKEEHLYVKLGLMKSQCALNRRNRWVVLRTSTNVRKQMQRVEKQLGIVQSVMYLLTQLGRRELLDQSGADNEEVNKRNGTWKCSSTTQVPQFNL